MSERTEMTGQHCGHIACLGMSYCTLTRPPLPAPDERQAGLRTDFARDLEHELLARTNRVLDADSAKRLRDFVLRALAQVPAQEESYGPTFVGFDPGHPDGDHTVVVGGAWHSTRVLSLTTDELDMLLAICDEGIEDWNDQTAVGLRAKVLALGAHGSESSQEHE